MPAGSAMNTLAITAFVRAIFFLILVALLIFVSAGSVRFWQGWLFLFLLSASMAAMSYYLFKHDPALFERRMRSGPRAESRTSQKIIQAALMGFLVAILIVAGLDHRFGWSRLPTPIVLIANAAVVASFAIMFIVLRENTFAGSTIGVESGQRVITTGMYAHVRHPMYAGGLLGIAVMPLALGSAWAIPLVIPLFAGIVARILDEERLLAAELPGYEAYRRTVRWRVVPMVW
jgi:protein-S-isoprenylcysteine O-methyltransferase Ste14